MKFVTREQAISDIKRGSSIIFSGFQLSRAPIALVNELIKQQIKDLEIISLPNPFPLDMLIKSKFVKKALFGFNGFSFENGFQIMPNWRKAIENNDIEYKETDVHEIIQALQAGIENKEYSIIDWIKDSDYVRYNNYKKVGGKLITPAIKPDFALIHAQRCDEIGNIEIDDPLTDNLVWKSANCVIVSVEEKVESLDNITIPKEKISSLVMIPKGAEPTACFGYYNYSLQGLNLHLNVEKPKGKEKDNKKIIDLIICVLARQIKENDVVLTGVASPIPMMACLLAQQLKKIRYINCSGAINPKPLSMPYSSANIAFLDQKEESITLPQIFDMDIDTMFMGAAQIDEQGNINMTCIGDYNNPIVKLPGPAATVYLRNKIKKSIIFVPKHSKKVFVNKVDFVTSCTNKDTLVVSNLGIFKLGIKPMITVVFSHSSVEEIQNNTSFSIIASPHITIIDKPFSQELKELLKIDQAGIRYHFR